MFKMSKSDKQCDVGSERQCLLENRNYRQYSKEDLDESSICCNGGKNVKISFRKPSKEGSPPLIDDVFSSRMNVSLPGGHGKKFNMKDCLGYFKMAVLVFIWIGCCFILMTKSVKIKNVHQLSIPSGGIRGYLVPEQLTHNLILLSLKGAMLPPYYANLSDNYLTIWIQILIATEKPSNFSNLDASHLLAIKNISEIRRIPLVSESVIGVVPEVKREEYFELSITDCDYVEHCYVKVNMVTNLISNFPISLTYDTEPINRNMGVVYAACILIFLYILIIFEIVHKTLASIIASTMSIAVLAALNARPTTGELISWIDTETLLLLFSMMTLVAILGETGIFDFLAVLALKITRGNIWPLINTLCLFTIVLSCFLDNVTTALLMTPVTIRLCEMMRIKPVPVLISMIIYANIGGALTPIGDPPNVIIASNPAVIKSGIDFSLFTLHMSAGGILCLIVTYIQLRATFNIQDFKADEPNDVQDLKREIAVWKRAAASMGSYSKEENLVKNSLIERTCNLLGKLNDKTSNRSPPKNELIINIGELENQYNIRDKVLLIKSTITLCFVICTFFLHSLPGINNLGLAWTAFLGALLLLILSGREDIDAVVAKVEWGTLLFFASLFILMEALSRLGLIDWIGNQARNVIMSVGQESRLAVAILIILWVSAVASAFVDNIPLTTMMIRIATALAENRELGLPLQPLIWALAFGACLGGNGTLFGSSSNIVCAGVAEQHGYKLSFLHFMKISVPVTLATLCVVTVYLLTVHVVWTWH